MLVAAIGLDIVAIRQLADVVGDGFLLRQGSGIEDLIVAPGRGRRRRIRRCAGGEGGESQQQAEVSPASDAQSHACSVVVTGRNWKEETGVQGGRRQGRGGGKGPRGGGASLDREPESSRSRADPLGGCAFFHFQAHLA